MSKFRSYSIVIHNVKDDSKLSVENHFQKTSPSKLLVAMEPYPEEEGFHVHVFVSYKSQRSFKSVLSATQSLSDKIVAPRPEGETRDWGRVQVDQMRGTFSQATAYLTEPQKDKPVDPDVQLREFERERLQEKFNWACDMLSNVYISSLTGDSVSGRKIIREYESRGEIPEFWKLVRSVWEQGPPALES